MGMMIMAMIKVTEHPMPTLMLNLNVAGHHNGIPTGPLQAVSHLLVDVVDPSTVVVASQDLPQPMDIEDMVQQDPQDLSMALLQAEGVPHPSLNLTPILPVSYTLVLVLCLFFFS